MLGVDKEKLVALVQSRQSSDDDDDGLSALAAATYKSHSSDTVDALNDLLDKAQTELDDSRHAESSAAHNFALLEQFLRTSRHRATRPLRSTCGCSP